VTQNGPGPLAVLSFLLVPVAAAAASFPPELRFRTIDSAHVRLHYPEGLEAPARRALALAEDLLAAHQARYGTHIRRVHIVLADVEDDANGFATPLPYPMVQIRLVAPAGNDDLGNYEDWLRTVLTHELAHVVHLDQARGWWGAGRAVLGRAPFLFPNGVTPMWTVEGLATFEETEETAFGRGTDSDARMVLRMEAAARGLPGEDRPVLGLDRWPAGQAGYLFGQAFLRDATRRFGPDTLPRLARANSGTLLPYLDEVTFSKVTGAGLHQRWEEWRRSFGEELGAEVDAIAARGLTVSTPLTTRGIRQVNPRFSPDGAFIAYTSRTLTRLPEVRVMRRDGGGDRHLAWRNGGETVAWTPDGAHVVFDEPERWRAFRTRFDLRVVRVADGHVRALTRGLRARDPDVTPDGRAVVFVRQKGEGGELAWIGLDGRGLRDITRSLPGVQWSDPAVAPDGATVVAARWTKGGWLDLVRVDLGSGAVEELTSDRAKDLQPRWSADGTMVLFRSDRDGVSNLYALRLSDRALLRVTNVAGGAFGPAPAPDGRALAFAAYGAGGYDLHLMEFDPAALAPADPYVDLRAVPLPPPPPVEAPDHAYRPLPAALPRYWLPYFDTSGIGVRYGVNTGGSDPLFRHSWLATASWDSGSEKPSFSGVYQYDRFWPTLLVAGEERHERAQFSSGQANTLDRDVTVRVSLPVVRRLRSTQTVTVSWRRERETVEGSPSATLDLGGIETAWMLSSARQYSYSISPVDGWRLRLAALREDPALGSSVSLTKVLGDARAYLRGLGESDALALRLGAGTTIGRPTFRQSYAVGGFPDASLVDVVRTNQTVLRGYPDNAFTGRRFAHANAEYRVALAHPQRGWRTLPLFVRHLHAALFADAAHAWTRDFRLQDVKTSVGAVLGSDVFLGQGLPLTATVGAARGLAERGETRAYFRLGLSF